MPFQELESLLSIIEKYPTFLTERDSNAEIEIADRFWEVAEWFSSGKSEIFSLPSEFRESLLAYRKGDERVEETMQDVRNMWLILSELKDYIRLMRLAKYS